MTPLKPCDCGSLRCDYADVQEIEPCWGEITVVDEVYTEDDYWWVHACEGHEDVNAGDPYKPDPALP